MTCYTNIDNLQACFWSCLYMKRYTYIYTYVCTLLYWFQKGMTVLHWAVKMQLEKCVQILLQNKASASMCDKVSKTSVRMPQCGFQQQASLNVTPQKFWKHFGIIPVHTHRLAIRKMIAYLSMLVHWDVSSQNSDAWSNFGKGFRLRISGIP